MVIKLAGSEPIKGATVSLVGTEDRNNSVSISTDSGGRFAIKGVRPGSYRLSVSKNAFVAQEYGQRKPGDPGSVLTLHPGQDIRDVIFRMIPSAVISGRILDEDGEPMPHVTVSALREIHVQGTRKLRTQTDFQTNDLGEYRLFGLPPGKYLVTASLSEHFQFQGTEQRQSSELETAYSRLYYPGTPDAEKAAAIRVKAGEEIPAVEILMRQFQVYRVRGHVYNQIARRSSSGINLMLYPRSSSLEWDPNTQQVRVEAADGAFEIRDVLPGPYVLQAHWFEENRMAHVSQVNVDVSNTNLDDVSLFLTPGTNVSGRVVWDGPPALQAGELRVLIRPVDGSRTMFAGGTVRVDPSNAFTLQDLTDGTYRPQVWGQSNDCFVKDVRYGTASVFEDGFTVTRGTAPGALEITISSRGARVQGSVLNADNLPAAGVWVVLVPDAKHRSRFELYKRQATDQYGHFAFRGIAPGEYKVFSWEEVEDGAWQDPDFLGPFEIKGESVEVKESEQKSVSVVAIRVTSESKP